MQPLSSAHGASESSRHEVEYDPGLCAAELLATVRALLATRRHAEQLICRYLADLADRVDDGRDEWLGARVDSLGCVIAYEAVDDIARRHLGLSRRNTLERIRVGRALRTLPQVEQAFVNGELSYSRVREVTRIATGTTEVVWLELAQMLDMRTLERRVAQASVAATNDVRHDGGDVELDPFEQDTWDLWNLKYAENDRPPAIDGPTPDPRRAARDGRNGLAPPDRLSPDRGDDVGGDPTGAGWGRREPLPSDEPARADARVEWTSANTVRVTLELSRSAWTWLEPAVAAALRESADVLNAKETLGAVTSPSLKANPRQVGGSEALYPIDAARAATTPFGVERAQGGVERAPFGVERAQGGVELVPFGVEPTLGGVELARAGLPPAIQAPRAVHGVDQANALGISPQAAAGGTHLGISEPSVTGGVGEVPVAGMSGQVAAGRTHLGILEAPAPGGVGEVPVAGKSGQVAVGGNQLGKFVPLSPDGAVQARVTGELVSMDDPPPSAARAVGHGRERSPTLAKLPGTYYAPAAQVLAVMGGRGSWCLDSLVEASGLLVQHVSAALTFLELDGYVRQRAGRFVRC